MTPAFPRYSANPEPPRNDSAIIRVAVPALVTLLLWLVKTNDVEPLAGVCSFAILQMATWIFRLYDRQGQFQVPVISFILLFYWWYFSFELFFGNRLVFYVDGSRLLSEKLMTTTMLLVVLGLVALLVGAKAKLDRKADSWNTSFDIPEDPRQWTWVRIVLFIGTALMLVPGAAYILGEGGRQFIITLQTIAPTVAFVIIFRNYLRGNATNIDKILVFSFLSLRILGGLSSGWLGSMASTLVVCGVVYLTERRRIPLGGVALFLVYILFFQVGKDEFRNRYWFGSQAQTDSPVDQVAFWVDASMTKWSEAFKSGQSDAYVKLLSETLTRTSLLSLAATVVDRSPSEVPFQHGKTYAYFLYTFVPRFIWPDKPSVNDANQFYQVAYGLTSADSLESVSIACGTLAESYMNFGWLGALFVMFPLGMLLSYYQRTFLVQGASCIVFAIGVALIPQAIIIDQQLPQYLAGAVQQVIVCLVVFYPILRRTRPPMVRYQAPYLFNKYDADITPQGASPSSGVLK